MKFRLYIEDKAGTYVDCTHMVIGTIGGFGFKVSPEDGSASFSPPSSLNLIDKDNIFTEGIGTPASRWNGDFAERKVKITASRDGTEETLGVFRVSPEKGVSVKSDQSVVMRLEAMERKLQRGDASDLTYKAGWFQQVPWPSAINMVIHPEAAAVASLPSSLIEYEGFQYGASPIGRPGTFQDDGLHEIRERAIACTYNYVDGVYCFITERSAFEWDPDTGLWEKLTLPFTLDADHDFLGVWFRNDPGGSNENYLFISAPREEVTQTSGSGYYQPRNQWRRYVSEFKTWSTLYASALLTVTDDANLAPVIYRDVRNKNAATTALGIGVSDGGATSGNPWHENAVIPFNQYLFYLWSRKTQTGEEFVLGVAADYYIVNIDGTVHPLFSASFPSGNSWTVVKDANKPAREEFDACRLRGGRGYYRPEIRKSASSWSTGSHDPGLRHSLGNGPMFDMAFPEHDASYDEDWHIVFLWEWNGSAWRLRYQCYNNGGAVSNSTVTTLGANVVPTFVKVMVEPYSSGNVKVIVSFGWIDYGTTAAADLVAFGGNYSSVARSGVGLFTGTVATNGVVSWDSSCRTDLLTFTAAADATALCNRYWGYGYVDEEGIWSPIGCSMSYVIDGFNHTHVILNISCIDRANAASGDQGYGVPFRLYHLDVGYSATAYYQVNGDGERFAWTSAMPPMGMTDQWWERYGTYAYTYHNYFYNPADGGIYFIPYGGDTEPEPLAFLNVSDPFLNMGRLAVGNYSNKAIHKVVGVTSPVYPLTGEQRWPSGLYYGFFAGEYHSGYVELLDMENMDKHRAASALALIGDSLFFFGRDGTPRIEPRATSSASVDLTLQKKDFGSLERFQLPVVNYATRSIYDVIPGEAKVEVYLGSESFWNADPTVTGFGVYPVDLKIRCIGGGLVSRVYTRWAFKRTLGRLTTRLSQAATSGTQDIYVDVIEGIERDDAVMLSVDDYNMRISEIDTSTGRVHVTGLLHKSYSAGDPVWIDKKRASRWSDQLYMDTDGYIHAIALVGEYTSSGDVVMDVTSVWPFAPGIRFQIHHRTDPDGYDNTVYIVDRVERPEDYGDVEQGRIYFHAEGGGGLAQAVHESAPITCWMEFSPTLHAAEVGQSGIHFSAYGVETDDMNDDEEQPVVEGDTISVHYPGLICNKNTIAKATARDLPSVLEYGEKKASRLRANKFMDLPLATLDVNRRVRRGATPRIGIELKDVVHPEAYTLEPNDVIEVFSPDMFKDRSGVDDFTVKAQVVEARHTGQKLDLIAHELAGSFTRPRSPETEVWDYANDSKLWALYAYKMLDSGAMPGNGAQLDDWFDQGPNGNDGTVDTAGREPAFSTADGGAVVGTPANYDNFNLGTGDCHSNTDGLEVWILYQDSGVYTKTFASKYESSGVSHRVWWLRGGFFACYEDPATYTTANHATYTQPTDGNYHILRGTWTPGDYVRVELDGVAGTPSSVQVNDLATGIAQPIRLMAYRHGAADNCDNPIKMIAIFNSALTGAEADLVYDFFDAENPDT